MTRKLLIDEVQAVLGGQKKDAEQAVESVIGAIDTLARRGERIQIRGFGNFQMKTRAERMGRNPQTKEPIKIAARDVLVFKDKRQV